MKENSAKTDRNSRAGKKSNFTSQCLLRPLHLSLIPRKHPTRQRQKSQCVLDSLCETAIIIPSLLNSAGEFNVQYWRESSGAFELSSCCWFRSGALVFGSLWHGWESVGRNCISGGVPTNTKSKITDLSNFRAGAKFWLLMEAGVCETSANATIGTAILSSL